MEKTWVISDKYEVISKIKQGGFGVVYYGFDRKFEKPIAIKAIEPSLLQEAKYIDLFLVEAKNAAKLNHNNIVHVYDLIKTDDGQFFIIMEYIDGVDMRRLLKKCKSRNVNIPLNLGIYIIKELCKALEYAHNKRDLITNEPLRLVHQDISPSNIMISITGNVKLIDFGIAKIKFYKDGNEGDIILTGKLPYMAPEQLNGSKIDRRTDLFSLGSVFYEILTGTRLFQYENDEKIIDAIRKFAIDQQTLQRHDIPEQVQKILIKTLQKDPAERYQGANGIYIDLVEYLMTSSDSVELSLELSEFVKTIFKDEMDQKYNTLAQSVREDQEDEEIVFATESSSKTEETPKEVLTQDMVTQSPPEMEFTLNDPLFDAAEIDDRKVIANKSTTDKSIKEKKSRNDQKVTPVTSTHEPFNNLQVAEVAEEDPYHPEDQLVTSPDISPVKFDTEIANEEETKQPSTLADINQESDKNINIIRKGEMVSRLSKFSPSLASSVDDEEEGEDDIKTVIDVIRLSAKTHKKSLIIGAISMAAVFVIFMVLNISLRLTGFGERIYDYLLPPAIKIYSAPQGAKVYVDDKLINGKTPLAVSKISPGVHQLTLAYPGYPDLIRSFQVPSKGDLEVAGEKTRKGFEPYLFRFKTKLELISDPPGATIYINNIKYNQQSPTTLEWEVGLPFSIEMSKPGFQELTGFTLNTLDETAVIDDRRLWNFTKLDNDNKTYIIEGLFKKFIKISSIPSEAMFYLDGSPTPTGKTGSAQVIALSVGKHEILFTKAGFNSTRYSVKVDENGPKSIFAMLTRNVRFFAKDVNEHSDNDIGATIVRIYHQGKSYTRNDQTPCEISLAPINHKALIRKNGYKDAVATISPTTKVVVVHMEPENLVIEIDVVDALTNLPIQNAEISYVDLGKASTEEIYFGTTDDSGKLSNQINPGQYTFKVKKSGYFEKSANFNTVDGNKKLTFKLIIQ